MIRARRTARPSRRAAALAVFVAAASLAVPTGVAAAAPSSVDPANPELTLLPGASAHVSKTVTTSEVPPKPDLVLLADTTGSMGPALTDMKVNASTITGDILAAQPAAKFGVAEYKDLGETIPFRVNQDITGDLNAVQTGINQWEASGGGGTPEDGLNALYELATGAASFRADGTRIVAWFGDAPSHDPSGGHTLADTIAALQAAHIRVVAVNVGDLDGDGQASAITSATDGVLLNDVPATELSAAILSGISKIKVTVEPKVTSCDPGLSITGDPANVVVESGGQAVFDETVTAASDIAPGTYHCTVDFLVDGVSVGNIEDTTVHVRGLRINHVTVREGTGGTTPATFTVWLLGGASPDPVTVDYATADDTATSPADYDETSGTVTFAPGEVTKPVTVQIAGDNIDEADETFTVNLSSPSGAPIVHGTGFATIHDDDRNGGFACTATAFNKNGSTVAVANPANVPCVDDSKTVADASFTVGLIDIKIGGLTATTDQTPDDLSLPPADRDAAVSTAKVEYIAISKPGLKVELGLTQSQASVTCIELATRTGLVLMPEYAGRSNIASLTINGWTVHPGSAPQTIPLAIGTLRLNSKQISSGQVVQQAVALDTVYGSMVIAEAKADVHGTPFHPNGNPCQS
jgi:hypothetical protein